MAFLTWLQSFLGTLILYAILLTVLVWAFVQGGETISTAVLLIVLVFSIGRDAMKSGG
jgi:hypothetical protein